MAMGSLGSGTEEGNDTLGGGHFRGDDVTMAVYPYINMLWQLLCYLFERGLCKLENEEINPPPGSAKSPKCFHKYWS